jgi:hypothetical protein
VHGKVDETAVALRLKYNWKDYVKGLKTEAKYIYGFGAHPCVKTELRAECTAKLSSIQKPSNFETAMPPSILFLADFTNNDETAVALRLKYNWKDYVKGLKTEAKYIYGGLALKPSCGRSARQSYLQSKNHQTLKRQCHLQYNRCCPSLEI